MKKAFLVFLYLLLGVSIFHPVASADPGEGFEGFWEGTLTYREAALPVRVEIRRDNGALEAFLDIPTLVYARQPMSARLNEDSKLALDFPFGIGEIISDFTGPGKIASQGGGFSLSLEAGGPVPYTIENFSFGAFPPAIEGSLYLPEGEGPFPLVVLLAGSGNPKRENWSYASWADFYARQGVAAFIYDRRDDLFERDNGEIMGIEDHAKDVANAISALKERPDIDSSKIGVAGGSRGAWIAMALGSMVPDLAFMILLSPAPVTPAEQEVDSNLTGMALDGLSGDEIAAARNYYRLYFYVAQTLESWPLLESGIAQAKETAWGQYVDQPEELSGFRWWNANMNFNARGHLAAIKIPVLALWGGADFITPYFKYQGILRHTLETAGNEAVTTQVFANADHRIEIDPGIDSQGNWHWFSIAPGALKVISDWIWDIIE